ncbi:MAG: GNAT family N-acetyltransferase [Lawsonibacter sp.]|nr:GNAT family N-acetyltransferase [Lawsonibacter sp.]
MTTIYLIRHAEAEGNLYRRIHGWYDSLITENGFRQIEALRRRFEGISIDAVYASDLYRTKTTARAVYEPKGLPLRIDPGLRELNLGEWEDRTWGEMRHFRPLELDRFNATDPSWQAPGGEGFGQLASRMEEAVRRIAQNHPGQTVALFSHGMAIRQFTGWVKGVPPELWKDLNHSDNTAVTCVTWDGERFHAVFEGDNSHLGPSTSTLARQSWWRREGGKAEDVNLWFRPLDMETESELYLQARQEAWLTVHGEGPEFDGEGFLQDALDHKARSPWGVTCVMRGSQPAGILQLDPERYRKENAGYIPFCYIMPGLRAQGLGVQLIGQAVSVYRPLGRDKLRLRCASYNTPAQHFYARYGFVKIGEEQGSRVPLDILEKYIGYDR